MKKMMLFFVVTVALLTVCNSYAQSEDGKLISFVGYGNAVVSPFPSTEKDTAASAENEARISLKRQIIAWFFKKEFSLETSGNKQLKSLADFPFEKQIKCLPTSKTSAVCHLEVDKTEIQNYLKTLLWK